MAGHKAKPLMLKGLPVPGLRSAAGSASSEPSAQRSHEEGAAAPRGQGGQGAEELRELLRVPGQALQARLSKSVPRLPAVRYVLEPCGHRVVCSDCAVQLVDCATRSRTEGTGDRGSGTCPSCGSAITRAMRIFI